MSFTHIAVGGVFGVGFYREWHTTRRRRAMNQSRPETHRLPAEEMRRGKLVRRSHFMTIVAAWVVTVPAAALMSALLFLALNAAMS